METKSWRTSSIAILCWIICVRLIYMGAEMHDWDLSDMRKFTHQMTLPFLAFAVGWGLWHARDHKAK